MKDYYTYSFGIKSPLKFELDYEEADAINRFIEAMYKRQEAFEKRYGFKWSPHTAFFRIDTSSIGVEVEGPYDKLIYDSFSQRLDGWISKVWSPERYARAYKGDYLVCNDGRLRGPVTSRGNFFKQEDWL